MRDLDSRDLIAGDFVFVFGDVVSNIAIEPALVKHRARREKDKNAIMTMVLREVNVGHRIKRKDRQPAFIIDPDRDRCLHYEEIGSGRAEGHRINFDPELLTSHDTVEIRTDLIDCNIDICTPDVLGLWSDNFDYTNTRQSFLSGVLKDYELNGKTVHTHIVSDNYAARAKNMRMYDAINRDIIGRWTYPLCPDSNLVEDQSYQLARGSIFKEDGVSLARTSIVFKRVVLGQGTSIWERSTVGNSTLGRWWRIGNDALISASYIWNNVTIGNGTKVRQAIVADEAVIGDNCVIEPGALVSFGVRIADNTIVPSNCRIIRDSSKVRDSSNQTDTALVGNGGEGTHYKPDSDDESDTSNDFGEGISRTALSESSASELSETESEFGQSPDRSRRSSFRSDISEESTPNRNFRTEETANVLNGLQKGELPANIFLELNARRMGVNASQHEVRHVVSTAFMKRISNLISVENPRRLTIQEAVSEVFTRYQELVNRIIFDKDKRQKPDQIDFLLLVQKEALGRTKGDSLLPFITKEVYDLELIEEDGILQWWEDPRSTEGEMAGVRKLTEPFIIFLREAEEEEDEESDGNSEDK